MRICACALSVLALCLTLTTPAQDLEGEDVHYEGDVKLAGELFLPEGDGPWPAAVVIQGSGTSDRTNVWSRIISELFVERGVAILLTDKRGSGKSEGDWRSSGFNDLASDALAGVHYLQTREEIDSDRVGLVGLSQGGHYSPLAAAGRKEVAFVVDLSGSTISVIEQLNLEMANTTQQAGLAKKEVEEIIELNKAAGRFLLTGIWEPYAELLSAALDGPAQPVAAGFPQTEDATVWTYLRKVIAFNPIPYWSLVEQPVFVGLGELDEQDNVPVKESVRRLKYVFGVSMKENYEIVVAPGVGHGLWDDDYEFEPGFIKSLSKWLDEYVLTADKRAPSKLTIKSE